MPSALVWYPFYAVISVLVTLGAVWLGEHTGGRRA